MAEGALGEVSSCPNFSCLKTDVEAALGFRLASFVRLKGGSSLNFKAVRESDGFPFLVKLLLGRRQKAAPVLIARSRALKDARAVAALFVDAPEMVGEYRLVCLEWCEGRTKMPDQLASEELRDFIAYYETLSKALQTISPVSRADPLVLWREQVVGCCGAGALFVRSMIRREIPALDDVTYRQDELKVIFGDFHHGNILFKNGRVHRLLDLESLCFGSPADDWVRYFTCAYDHLKWKAVFRRRTMMRAFEYVVRSLPYSRHEWIVALNAAILRRAMDITEHPHNVFAALNLLIRTRFYRALKRIL